jgi:DNA-binding XRE family transcriptional regulator
MPWISSQGFDRISDSTVTPQWRGGSDPTTCWVSICVILNIYSQVGIISIEHLNGQIMGDTPKKSQAKADIKSVVAQQVKSLRCKSRFTQQELAERCKIYRTYLSRLENGDANPTLTVLAALAEALDVKVAQLLDEGGKTAKT